MLYILHIYNKEEIINLSATRIKLKWHLGGFTKKFINFGAIQQSSLPLILNVEAG